MKRKQHARTHFVRVPHLANLELLHASNLTHNYPPHIHEQLCIILVHQGSETTTVRKIAYTAFPGDLTVLHPEELHSSVSLNVEYRVFKIDANEFQRIACEVFGSECRPPYFGSVLINDSLAFQSLFDLYLMLEQNDSLLQHESEFVSTMGILLTRQNQTGPIAKNRKEDRSVDVVRDYLKNCYRENVSLFRLASMTNLDRFSLLRVFTKKFGIPPHEFQTQLRISHARELIRRGHSIAEAALETGFFDQSHLARHFKRIVGMTPGEYLSGCNIVQESHP
jgi:AraC-like DNA-binding protein